jgi:phosphoglycerate dehydrogenase-like enzyme
VAYLAGSVKKLVPRKLIENGLLVTNWGNAISRTISECGLLLILTAMRRSGYWNVAMHRDGAWKDGMKTITQSLFCRSIGLHGFGAIAQEMIPLLRPFDVSISAFSPSVPDAVFQKYGVTRSTSLEHLFSQHDIVVELAPYTEKNHHIVTEKLLRSIRPGGTFINIGRGAVVDEAALIRVARDRAADLQIGLDVYETEPLPKDSPLRGLPNVALLPHIAGPTKDRRQDTASFAIENLQRFLQGKPLESMITLDVYDRAT